MSFLNGDAAGFTPLDPTALSTGLTVAAVSGCSSPSFTGLQAIKTNATVAGNFVDIIGTVSFTASAATAVFDITVPSTLTAVFADASQVGGIAVVTSGTALGSLTSVVTTAATRNIRITLALGGTSGTYTANFIFAFKIN